jgi:hypothetical protein
MNDALYSQRDFSADAIAATTAANSVTTVKGTILNRTVTAQAAEGMQIANGRHCVTSSGLVHCGAPFVASVSGHTGETTDHNSHCQDFGYAFQQESLSAMLAAAGDHE